MAELRIANISKIYHDGKRRRAVPALTDFSLSVGHGECVALLGPSGAGKSTVLRLVARLEQPDRGEIFLDGVSILAQRPGELSLGMAFQYPALLPQLSARENLRLGARFRKQPEDKRWSERLAELLSLSALLERKPDTFSGGEQQRVALGRALSGQPKLLLLDEPLANLDPLSRLELRTVIQRVHRELNLTTLYVTHDQSEAANVADRIALMHEGKLAQFGTSEELYLKPRSLFAARFFGPEGLNVVHGRVVCSASESYLDLDPGRLPLPRRFDNLVGRQVAAGFRPGAVHLAPAVDQHPWIVQEKRSLGWTNLVTVSCGSHLATVHLLPGKAIQSATVSICLNEVLLFDPETGVRLE